MFGNKSGVVNDRFGHAIGDRVLQMFTEVGSGVVISYDAVLDLSALLAQADHALYRAKDNGRNRIEIASIELILDRVKRASAAVDRAASAKAAAKSAA